MLTAKSLLLKRSFQLLQRGFVNSNLSKKLFMPLGHNFQGIRTLYSLNNLGIDRFMLSSETLRNKYGKKDKFLETFGKFSLEDKVFSAEDLRLLIAYCQEDKSLLNDVMKFTKIYHDQIKHFKLRPFKFGTIIMRLMHYHNCPDEALKIVLDEDLGDMFYQITSYQILMDLLYENEKYEDVKIIMENIFFMNLFTIPTSCLTLVLAANYKIGTEEALNDSMRLLQKASTSKNRVSLRQLGFTAALALKLGKPEVTRDVLFRSDSISHFLIDNLSILTKAQLGHVEEVLANLKTRILRETPKGSLNAEKPIYCFEVIDQIEKIVNDTLEMEPIEDMKHLKHVLQTMNLLTSKTLDESICSPIELNVETETHWSSGNEGYVRKKSSKSYTQN